MIEYAAFARVVLAGNVGACLLVEPPAGEPQIIRDPHGLFMDDPVWLEHRIDIACDACSVVSQRHRGAAHDENICHDSPADKALAQGGECPFKLCPAKENVVRLAHAASRSLADKKTPCFLNAAGAQTSASARWISSSAGYHGRCRTLISAHSGAARSCCAARCSASAASSASHGSSPVGDGSSRSKDG